MRRLAIVFSISVALSLTIGVASGAHNVLTNGNLNSALLLDTWTLDETVTGMPGTPVNSAEIQDFANQPGSMAGQSGLWLRGFEGNIGPLMGQNAMINAVLSQEVAGSAGETYTLSGWSRWEMNYSGAVATLAASSPSGAVASPTDSSLAIEFLDAGNSVIGTSSLDLRTVQMNDEMWRQHTVMGVAPAGTVSVRAVASALDMVFNTDPGQSGFYDNFSLTAASAPATELLGNSNLNAPLAIPGFTLTESPGLDTASTQDFADRLGGGTGLWLRPFVSLTPEADATLSQTVAASRGNEYTFSAWSRWEANYSGGQTGSPTQTLMQMSFLDASNAVIGSPITLDLRTEQMNDNMWRQHVLSGFAPVGTASVRVSAIANDMFSTSGAQSAFFDDLVLTEIPEPSSVVLVGLGLAVVGWAARRRS